MNELAKKVGAPKLPSVNLLPNDIAERRAMRAVQMSALFAVLIALGVVVAGFVLFVGAKGLAESDLNNALEEQASAIEERDAKVSVYYAATTREAEEFTLAQIAYGEMDYEDLSAAVFSTADDATSFDGISVFGPSAFGLGSPAEGYYGGGVGVVTFTARASSQADATALIQRIEALPGISQVHGSVEGYLSDGGDDYWGIEGSATVTDLRLTGRLTPEEGITVATLLSPDQADDPAISPSPEPDAPADGEEN